MEGRKGVGCCDSVSQLVPACRTYFGKEAEVAAHTHLDSHRAEKPKNYWMLVTGNPRNASSTMPALQRQPVEDTGTVEPDVTCQAHV